MMEQEMMMAQGGFPEQENGAHPQIMPAPGVGVPDGMAPLRMNLPQAPMLPHGLT